MFFDEEFISAGTRSNNFLRGERNPGSCAGDYEGKISDLVISGDVNGRALTRDDFIVPKRYVNTVPNLIFESVITEPTTTTTTTTQPPPTTSTSTSTSTSTTSEFSICTYDMFFL